MVQNSPESGKWAKMVQNDPKQSVSVILDPSGPLWYIDKPAIGHFWSKNGPFLSYPIMILIQEMLAHLKQFDIEMPHFTSTK